MARPQCDTPLVPCTYIMTPFNIMFIFSMPKCISYQLGYSKPLLEQVISWAPLPKIVPLDYEIYYCIAPHRRGSLIQSMT
jgi:hypothetical protein